MRKDKKEVTTMTLICITAFIAIFILNWNKEVPYINERYSFFVGLIIGFLTSAILEIISGLCSYFEEKAIMQEQIRYLFVFVWEKLDTLTINNYNDVNSLFERLDMTQGQILDYRRNYSTFFRKKDDLYQNMLEILFSIIRKMIFVERIKLKNLYCKLNETKKNYKIGKIKAKNENAEIHNQDYYRDSLLNQITDIDNMEKVITEKVITILKPYHDQIKTVMDNIH